MLSDTYIVPSGVKVAEEKSMIVDPHRPEWHKFGGVCWGIGRTTGSKVWRDSRGEAGSGAEEAPHAAATPWRRASVVFEEASGRLHGGAVRASGQHAPIESVIKVLWTIKRPCSQLRQSILYLKDHTLTPSLTLQEGGECNRCTA